MAGRYYLEVHWSATTQLTPENTSYNRKVISWEGLLKKTTFWVADRDNVIRRTGPDTKFMYSEWGQQPIFCAYDLVVNNFYNQWNRPQAGTRPGFAIVYRLSPRTGLSCYDIRRPCRRLNRTEEASQSPTPATRRIAMLSFSADFQQFSACLSHLYDRLLSACATDSSFDCDPAASFCGFRRRRSVCDRLFTAVRTCTVIRTCTVHSFVCLSLFAQQSENAWLHIQLR